MLENVFVFLYPVVVVISIVGYIPQIKSLITAKTCPDNISIHSWYIWTLSTFLTLGYGVTHIYDFMFNLAAGVNFVLVAATTALIYYNMNYRFRKQMEILEELKEHGEEEIDIQDVAISA